MADCHDLKDAADQNFDYMFKILLIGNSCVGKTSFLIRFVEDTFSPNFCSTVGIDFKLKVVTRQGKRVKLQMWDTAGQERYHSITQAYYRGTMGFILMYDVTNEESFHSIHDWVSKIKEFSWESAQIIVVGNKCDMEDERVVSTERGKQLTQMLGIKFFECSAKENYNITEVFECLVDNICNQMSNNLNLESNIVSSSTNSRLSETSKHSTSGCHC